jgi:2-polyprenyl-6-methoxyphenol hydroxylase-like FAD-dependent oxidoreductase
MPEAREGRRLPVLIIGAGIGGLTTALALRRLGIDTRVFERASELSKIQVGAGLHLWPNALRVLQDLGLGEDLRASGTPMQRMEFWSSRGKLLYEMRLDYLERAFGAPGVGVSRAGFHQLLAGALDGGVLRFGAECVGFEQDADGVTVRFAGGRDERGDALIGADGINSVLRAQLLGPARPRYAGYTIWRAIVDFDRERAPLGTFRVVWGRGSRFVFYHASERELYWAAIANAPEGGRDPQGQTRPALLARFRDWPAPTAAIIEATKESSIRRQDIYDRPPVRRWGTGRMTLLGDAAHAMTFNVGQGACQAIEDAAVLSKCLAAGGSAAAALRAYEAQRRDRTARLIKRAWRLGALGRWEHPLSCALRDTLLRTVLKRAIKRNFESDWSYRA